MANDWANDDAEEEKAIFFRGFFYGPARLVVGAGRWVARLLCAISLHFATICGRTLSSGTSPERIAPESLTHLHSGFVHRNISR